MRSGQPAAQVTLVAVTGSCSLPPGTYDDLAACAGTSGQIELNVADSFQGKTTAKITIPSKDPRAILAAMGAYTAEWSIGADSFTAFAYGSADEYENGSAYNRGRIFWNDGGPITLDICTEWHDVEGIDSCTSQETFTVANR